MDKTRLRAILDAYGAEPARWPEAEREAALSALHSGPELVRAGQEAALLDRMIAHAPTAVINDALLTRILESAPRALAKLQPRRRPGRNWSLSALGDFIAPPTFGHGVIARPAAIMMLAVCVGLGVGALVPVAVDSTAAPSDVDMLSAMWGNSVISQDGVNE